MTHLSWFGWSLIGLYSIEILFQYGLLFRGYENRLTTEMNRWIWIRRRIFHVALSSFIIAGVWRGW